MRQDMGLEMQLIGDLRSFLRLDGPDPISRFPSSEIQLLLLEHDEQLDDVQLESLFPWSAQDLKAMASFTHRGARTSLCLSRFLVRHALASVTGLDSKNLPFGYGPFGKPFLIGSDITFNWSHATGCVVLTLASGGASGRKLGCDVEDTRQATVGYRELARSWFSVPERDWLEAAPDARSSHERFLGLYVQKEAQLKASGAGTGDGGGRYLVALCMPASAEAPLTLRAHRFGAVV